MLVLSVNEAPAAVCKSYVNSEERETKVHIHNGVFIIRVRSQCEHQQPKPHKLWVDLTPPPVEP